MVAIKRSHTLKQGFKRCVTFLLPPGIKGLNQNNSYYTKIPFPFFSVYGRLSRTTTKVLIVLNRLQDH